MISQNTIQQILSRLDIIDVIGGFVKLKKRGSNYLGLCPFHNEKTPSFTVSPSKEIYKCFGCGRSGNTISFIMEHEKYSYVETLKWLANKYGVEIEETFQTDEQKQSQLAADSLYILNQFAAQYFSKQLFETEEGQDIGLAYFKERGYREDIIKKFQLGYSPEQKDAFTKEAIAKQYNAELLIKSGLSANRNDQLVDNYRGRVIFPVHNHSGKVLGFGARILKSNEKAPKYINTPENEIYIKSKILYGSYFARQAIDKADECLLVEGYTDVISLHQAGVENVVASGGTSLTPDQLRLIKKYSNNLTIIYDGDAAGVKAALRGLDLALEESLNVRLVLLPENEDPDSYVNKVGSFAFTEFIQKNKKDFILFQLEVALKDAAYDSVKKAEVVNQVAETISKINKAEDFTKQQDYIKQCAEILKIDEAGLHNLVNKFIREKLLKQGKKPQFEDVIYYSEQGIAEPVITDLSNETFSLIHQDVLQERAIVKVLLEHGHKEWDNNMKVADYIFSQEIDDDLFENKKLLNLIKDYRDRFYAGQKPTLQTFVNSNDNELVSTVISVTNFPYEESKRWREDEISAKVNKRIWDLNFEDFMEQVVNNKNSNEFVYLHYINNNYKEEVNSTLIYLKIRKVNRLILQNQKDWDNNLASEKLDEYQNTHLHLKKIQQELGGRIGNVIFPFG
ncbi:MAG TPA: DNA primase [Chitinophagaceae bacterium]|nr:DNA primase [Chitinophagaceae bacterium]